MKRIILAEVRHAPGKKFSLPGFTTGARDKNSKPEFTVSYFSEQFHSILAQPLDNDGVVVTDLCTGQIQLLPAETEIILFPYV